MTKPNKTEVFIADARAAEGISVSARGGATFINRGRAGVAVWPNYSITCTDINNSTRISLTQARQFLGIPERVACESVASQDRGDRINVQILAEQDRPVDRDCGAIRRTSLLRDSW